MIRFVVVSRAQRFALHCLAATACILTGFQATEVRAESGTPQQLAPTRNVPRNSFRLGTAGRPLSWSTGIADFNRDGAPDLAIADRVGRSATGYQFRLEFSVSGLSPRSVAFESPQEALAVHISDIDHDNDLDVVIASVFSHEIVSVWVNDGHGRFDESDIHAFPATLTLGAVLNTEPLLAYPVASGVLKKHDVSWSASHLRSPTPPIDQAIESRGPFSNAARGMTRSLPRAPPIVPAFSIA